MNIKFVDRVYDEFNTGKIELAMQNLYCGLRKLRLQSDEKVWQELVEGSLLTHPVREIIHDDPITRRSFEKPRGYAGDAILMDMIYRHPSALLPAASHPGREVFEYNTNSEAARAVRYRRDYLAHFIDARAEHVDDLKVLSVACGHCRELELSNAVRGDAIAEFLAIDQDPESLEVVRRAYGDWGVKPLRHSVREVLTRRFKPKGLDLIYSSGLYDYLDLKVGSTLTRRLFDMLAPGGVLLLTNFLPAISAVGYMESYMAWYLIYRDESEMVALAKDIPRPEIDRLELFIERQQNIIFLKIYKRK